KSEEVSWHQIYMAMLFLQKCLMVQRCLLKWKGYQLISLPWEIETLSVHMVSIFMNTAHVRSGIQMILFKKQGDIGIPMINHMGIMQVIFQYYFRMMGILV